jgi:hypothetical protein
MSESLTVADIPWAPSPSVATVASPSTSKRSDGDAWPRPMRAPAYHGIFGDVVGAISPHTEADPHAMLLQMLVMFGSLIGRTAHFKVEADVHYLNLYVGIVGQTAKGRKGVSRGRSQGLFEAVDPDWVRNCVTSGLSSGEGLIWTIRDAIEKQQPIKERGRVVDYQTVVEDAGVSDKRLMVIEPELAATFKVMTREGNTLSPVIRQAWDGRDLRTLTKSSAARATAPHVSLIGHITGDELRRDLNATECANGFGNRFLWACARRSRELPDGGEAVDLEPYGERIRLAVDHARQVTQLRRDADASCLWHRAYGPLSAGRPGLLGAMTGRAEAQVMRLACLYALGDRSYVVGLSHLQAALEVWRYCFASAKFIFGSRLGDPTADEILRALRQAWPASLAKKDILHDVFSRNRSAAEINRALGLLLDCGLARFEEDRSGPGRPAERWFASQQTDDLNDFNDLSTDIEPANGTKVVKVVRSSLSELGADDERL